MTPPSLAYQRLEDERNDLVDVSLVITSPGEHICPPDVDVQRGQEPLNFVIGGRGVMEVGLRVRLLAYREVAYKGRT